VVIDERKKKGAAIKSQASKGFVVAWMASVAVAFLSGCLHSIYMERGHVAEFLEGMGAAKRDALTAFFLVGFVAAMAAALIAALAAVFIAWPMYLAARRYKVCSLFAYLSAGIIISLIVIFIILPAQRYLDTLLPSDYLLEIISILIAGPVAAMSFWLVARPDRYNDCHNSS
jgi:hypothetical protein